MLIMAYSIILYNSFNEKKYRLTFILIVVLMWAFIEPCILNIGRNIFVIFLLPILEMGEIKFLAYNNIKLKKNGIRCGKS